MKKTVIVAAHKPYRMPDDPMYVPVQAGSEGKEAISGYRQDNTGDNISLKNPNYCELTALYWAWKNLDYDAMGLVHYRRYLKGTRRSNDPFDMVLSSKEVEELLNKYDVIVPKPQNYVIETIRSHYGHTHYEKDLDACRNVLEHYYPGYVDDWDYLMSQTKAHMFNMFIMKQPWFDRYCEFLFGVLSHLEKEIDVSGYDAFQARVFGRISELLLDTWLRHNHLKLKEVPLQYMEKIDWPKKIRSFLSAKFLNKKYEGSF